MDFFICLPIKTMVNKATKNKITENKSLLNTNNNPPPLKTNNVSNSVSKNL